MKKLFLHSLLLVFVFNLLSASNVFGANFYDIDSSIELISETESESFGSMSLVLEPHKNAEVLESIDFLSAGSKHLYGRLIFSPQETVIWQGPGESDRFYNSEKLFIAPGFSLPVNILPIQKVFDSENLLIVHEFQRKSGNRVFLDRVEISAQLVGFSEAEEKGWLRYYKKNNDNFFLVCAKNLETGELIVQQLWEPVGEWWIYEETSFRRSWRFFE